MNEHDDSQDPWMDDRDAPAPVSLSSAPAHADYSPQYDGVDADEWIKCPYPTIGWRRVLLTATGINLGPGSQERALRLMVESLINEEEGPA